uniref:RES family NAD+ phosphorylase n=1 Tax=Undibacterium luofuense TaxID=2828733 RepID=UPI0030ED488D
MITAWRIATDTPGYTADDMQGTGAKLTGGRWNREGTPLVYCASNISLACLETLVHLNAGLLPLNRYLVSIQIPPAVWQAAEHFDANNHIGWDAIPAGKVSLDYGSQWAASSQMMPPSQWANSTQASPSASGVTGPGGRPVARNSAYYLASVSSLRFLWAMSLPLLTLALGQALYADANLNWAAPAM